LIKLGAKLFLSFSVLILLAIFVWFYAVPQLQKKKQPQQEIVNVVKVNDGDTFEIDKKDESGKNFRVRMLGIDTPEKFDSDKLDRDAERTGKDKKTIQKLGELASDFTKALIDKKKVNLEKEPGHEDKDKYGRLLRYVYLEDGTFVNKKIVEEGYANAFRQFKISKLDEMIAAEKDARENKRGLWGN
jgi:micrococcal nuclease